RQFQAVIDWLDELGCRDELAEAFFLEMGVQRGSIHLSEITENPEAREIFGTGREAIRLIASKLPAHEFFRQGQEKGMAVGAILSPEEVLADPHFIDRGFPVQVHHDDLGRSFTYPGLPFQCRAAPGGITRAPRLGEHQHQLGTAPG
ncbi:MAG: CoA transferase, partial [Acidimicrobiales bacterium]|nr:CoA transferase [Acidimicrobiales bacterium]